MTLNREINARRIGLKNRKYEEKCTYCGKEEHYAKGYCKACYNRYKRNGFVEPKYNGRSKRPPKLTEKQIKRFLKDVKKNKNKLQNSNYFNKWFKGIYKPTFNSAKKIYEELGINIYKRLKIEGGEK